MNLKTKLIAGVTGFTIITGAGLAYAESELGITADVTFVEAITLTLPVAVHFGEISTSAAALETFVVDTAGTMTASVPANALGSQSAGSLTIAAGAALLDIDVDNFTTVNTAVFDIDTPTCNYNGLGEAACATADTYQVTPVDNSAYVMTIGMTLTMNGAATAGLLSETFDVHVNYN